MYRQEKSILSLSISEMISKLIPYGMTENSKMDDLIEENTTLKSELKRLCGELQYHHNSEKVACVVTCTHDDNAYLLLEDRINSERNENLKLLDVCKKLKEDLQHSQNHISDQAAIIKDLNIRLQESESCRRELEKDFLQILPLRIRILELTKQIEHQKRDIEALINSNNNTMKELVESNGSKEVLLSSIKDLESLLSRQQTECSLLNLKYQDSSTELTTMKSKHDAMELKEKSLNAMNSNLQYQIKSVLLENSHFKEEMLILRNKLQLRDEALQTLTRATQQDFETYQSIPDERQRHNFDMTSCSSISCSYFPFLFWKKKI